MKDTELGRLLRARDAVTDALRKLRADAMDAEDARVAAILRDVVEQMETADATLELETPDYRGGGRISSGRQMEIWA